LDVAVEVANNGVQLTRGNSKRMLGHSESGYPAGHGGLESPWDRPHRSTTLLGVTDHAELEEGTDLTLDFTKLLKIGDGGHHVVPVAVQDADTGEVLIVAYANEDALSATLERGEAVFYSTSRNEIWHKGATSGDTLGIVDVSVNCEQNSLLYRVRPNGEGACHTKNDDGTARAGCYYRTITDTDSLRFA
jgi:phosphoribosyl-AMP cyclohydrolase